MKNHDIFKDMSEYMAHEIVIRIQCRITRGLKDFLADKKK